MGTVLTFDAATRPARSSERRAPRNGADRGEVILFPGVRMERHALDLAARIGRNSSGDPQRGADRDTGRTL